jgi:V8-like Glu-specific endopeptidase
MKRQIPRLQLAILAFAVMLLSTTAFGQPEQIPYHVEPYVVESGVYNGNGVNGSSPIKVFSAAVQVNHVPWLQLHFSEINLGQNSYVKIFSDFTDVAQRLDAASIEQWNYFSAFFNGDKVQIELYVAPMDNNIYFNVQEVVVGDWATGSPIESICGTTDDRQASNDPAVGRLLNVGCTGWIIPNGKIVSAGHCLSNSGSVNVLEFNVPLSLPGGTIQHPGPEDQYSADVSTIVHVNGGVGNDWGVFEVFPNSITGLLPKQAQNAYFTLVQTYSPDSIRITGYGTDNGTANQTQQTHVGPNAGSSGTTMRYRTDTQGGNSGSPIIDALTHHATGVHTHGGCTSTGGNNNGTSFFHTAFWAAVDSGIIPVELSSFTATAFNDYVELSWITSTETNNAGFSVERYSVSDKQWTELAFISGSGNSTQPVSYSYSDYQLNVGSFRYRLKQIDYDGSYTYSSEVFATISAPKTFALFQNYPNPFNPTTNIKFNLPAESIVSLKVFNTLGEVVAEVFSGSLNEGYHEINFNAASLTSGIYFYSLESNEFVDVKKMMILK